MSRGCGIGGTELSIVQVDLRPGVTAELDTLKRNFYTSSSPAASAARRLWTRFTSLYATI